MNDGSSTAVSMYRRVLKEARKYRVHVAGILLLSLVTTPLALLTPVPLKIVVDNALDHRDPSGLLGAVIPGGAERSAFILILFAGLFFVIIRLLVYVQALAAWVLKTYTGEKLSLHLRAKLFRHVQRLSLSYHDTTGTTDSTYRIVYDADAVPGLVVNGLTPLITAGVTLMAMIYVTARIDLLLAAIAMIVTPILFVLIRAYGRRMKAGWLEVKAYESRAMSVVQEALSAARVVKAFGQEDREHERFVRQSSKSVWGQIRLALLGGSFDLAIGLTLAIGSAAVLMVGGLHARNPQTLSTGDLILIMAYLAMLYEPLETISQQFALMQSSLASAERVFSVLDEAPEVIEHPRARPLSRAGGAVSFQGVSFGYGADRMVLNEITCEIPAGSSVGIAGVTGAGKTTLVSLLTRFYDPTAGRIVLDGVDVRHYRLADLRNQFAIVLQDPVLFSTTIAENIAYARPEATREEIVEAAKAAGIHEAISRLPDGYETQVGERGTRLSGGERQRVSLARAFLKDAPILILDEPTSSVDFETEAQIMESMERLMQGRTAFMIAHRTSTLERCDLLLAMRNGSLVSVTDTTEKPASTPATPREDGRGESVAERSVLAAALDDTTAQPPSPSRYGIMVSLARALLDDDPATADRARQALRHIDPEIIGPWVRHALAAGNPSEASLAVQVAEAVRMTGVAAQVLERAARLPPEDRAPFVRALGSFDLHPEECAGLLERVPQWLEPEAIRIVSRARGPTVLTALRALAFRPSESVQRAVLEASRGRTDPAAIEIALHVLVSPASAAVREAAGEVLRLAGFDEEAATLSAALSKRPPPNAAIRSPEGRSA